MIDQVVSISPGFQYSVNLKYDVDNEKKIASYIPTEKAIELLWSWVKSVEDFNNNRARFIVGPYGTGKSHLGVVLAALMKGTMPRITFQSILEKIRGGEPDLADAIEENILGKKYLSVLIVGNGQPLRQALINGLKKALEESNLDHLMPLTAFNEIERKIRIWESEYTHTYKEFVALLQTEFHLDVDAYNKMVQNYDEHALNILAKLYPRLSAGDQFNPFHTDSIDQLYLHTAMQLQQYGYNGILIIMDEFNKYLERAVASGQHNDLMVLQDLAEMCNRSEQNQVHLLLLSHQHFSEYTSRIPQETIDEWRKIEGRFQIFELSQRHSKSYYLMSKVLLKGTAWNDFVNKYNQNFSTLTAEISSLRMFDDLTDYEIKDWVIQGCYPLNPVTTFCLPRLANKVAQNERTIFTYLASLDTKLKDLYGKEILEPAFFLLSPDSLYDYFEESIRKDKELKTIYIQVNQALSKIEDPSMLEERLIKTIGVVKSISESKGIAPTVRILEYAFYPTYNSDEINEVIERLLEQKVIYVRKSDGHIIFFDGSDLNFDEEIQRICGDSKYRQHFSVSKILNENFLPYPVVAHRFNDEFEMTRYFNVRFYLPDEIITGIDWERELEIHNCPDGLIALIVAQDKNDISALMEMCKTHFEERVILAIPKTELYLIETLFDFKALTILSNDNTFLLEHPLASVEISAYLEDCIDQIENELTLLTDPSLNQVRYFYGGKEKRNIRTHADLSRFVSEVCQEVYKKTPKINNELINKNRISPTVATARKKLIRAILNDRQETNLGLTGFGPEVSIFNSMLKRTGIYSDEAPALYWGRSSDDSMAEIQGLVDNWILNCSVKEQSFLDIYKELINPPYGLRKGIIPVILALGLRKHQQFIVVKDERGIEQSLNEDLLENIARRPGSYSLTLETWNAIKEEYIVQLSSMFSDFIEIRSSVNKSRLLPVAMAIKNWYLALPKFSRETMKYGQITKSFIRALKNPSLDSQEFLFRRLPLYLTGLGEITTENLEECLSNIHNSKEEMEEHLPNNKSLINEFLITIFKVKEDTTYNSCLSAIRDWFDSLNESTLNHSFSGVAGEILNLVRSFNTFDTKVFIDQCCRIVSGLRIEDWSDEIFSQFQKDIELIKEEIDSFDSGTRENNQHGKIIKIVVSSPDGEKTEKTFDYVPISDLGQLLLNTLEHNIQGFSNALDVNEKRQILFALMEKLA